MTKETIKNKFISADKIGEWSKISTGCHNIDNILRGGIATNGIVEICGCSGVGKTQLCLQLALQIQMEKKVNDKIKGVVYISTEDVFPSKRLNQMASLFRKKQGYDITFEDNIYLEHVADSIQLKKCLTENLPRLLSIRTVDLIIIDSVAGLFRSENENCDYVFRSREFNEISNILNRLQDRFDLAVVVVNQVTDNITEGTSEPCLGLAWANNVTCRYFMSRYIDSPVRKFEIVFAPDVPVQSTDVVITSEGILNA